MIALIVGGVDITHRIVSKSVRLSVHGTFRSDFSATLETNFTDGIYVSYGMEAILSENGHIIWGGIVTEATELFRTYSRCQIRIRCKGYEHILSRRVCESFSYSDITTGEIVKNIFNEYLSINSPKGEGLLYNPDLFDEGVHVAEYVSQGARVNQIFDDLAAIDGCRWWIGENKTFYYLPSVPVTDSLYSVDVTGVSENRLTDVSSLEFKRETAEYRNVQVVVGAEDVRGEARNTAEITRMAAFGGSGEYANITVNKNILTEETAAAAAEHILKSYENEYAQAVFTTETDGFSLFDKIFITAPQFGYFGATAFVITEIIASDRPTGSGEFKFSYKIKAKLYSEHGVFRPSEDWTETFSQLVGKNDSTASQRISSGSSDFKADNILAGRNIVLEKSKKDVTIHSTADISTVSLVRANVRNDGLEFETEDGVVTEFSYTFDENGNISQIIDNNGRIIDISWE